MTLQLLLREDGVRTFALAEGSSALIFQSIAGQRTTAADAVARCQVEFSTRFDASSYRVVHSRVHGTLGLINIGKDVFLCLISNSVRVATVRPSETVQKIISVDFYCINHKRYDIEQSASDDWNLQDHSSTGDYNGDHIYEHPCSELKKMLSDGTFYYSLNFDLTNRLQDRISEASAFDIDSLDADFLWNKYMVDSLLRFRSRLGHREQRQLDSLNVLTTAVRGFVSTLTQPRHGTTSPALLTLISRLSCRRAGTRFNARGIDDEGNVANFVETETFMWIPPNICFSYAQIRGSVPLFWEQSPGFIPGQQKIQISRSAEATQFAFDKHFEKLQADYGVVSILNLLSDTKAGEAELIAMYKHHVQHSPLGQVLQMGTSEGRLLDMQFDFHAESRAGTGEAANAIRRLVGMTARSFAYFLCLHAQSSSSEASADLSNEIIIQQEGIFRTNCLDCLDRTNLVQTLLSRLSIELFFEEHKQFCGPDIWMRHSSLWADNGDALSKIYAGTGAIKSSLTRNGKMNLAGALADARKSATRLYVNNFVDKGKQNTIDMLLGRLMEQSPVELYDPLADYVEEELKRRETEFISADTIDIWIGTFNLNGKRTGLTEDLRPWLHKFTNRSQASPDIVVAGFQEMVELSPQQIMSTDPHRRREWEQAVKKALNQRDEGYVLLRSGQLVGAALIIFVKAPLLSRIRNVEGSEKKTGMSGIAGNKGAVAIRLEYSNTSLCFLTAHMAAGFGNIEERNRDYQTISNGLKFQRNRSIEDHDAIIWAGDFNYRIGLSDGKVRQLVQNGDLEGLYSNDQLNLQMMAGRCFPHYSEPAIDFNPTYKYDYQTDHYDTSEKARIPAWCDRILFKGQGLRNKFYSTAPLRFSDHRPVFATFDCYVNVIDETRREILRQTLLEKGDIAKDPNISDDDQTDEDTMDNLVDPSLPPPSSDGRKWWLDDGLPVKSAIQSSHATHSLPTSNNPFVEITKAVEKTAMNVSDSDMTTRSLAPPIPRKPEGLAHADSKGDKPTSQSIKPVDLLDDDNEKARLGTFPVLLPHNDQAQAVGRGLR